jgi:hypothetical protein
VEHFQLHFEPKHRVLYQEPTGAWLTTLWQDIATSPSIKRIQYNTEQLQNYIIVDIDNSDIYKYREANLPEPNFIVKNKNKAGAHLFWVLDRTIATPYYKRVWKEVFKSFTLQAGGDELAKGFIAKNLNNNIDFDIEFIEHTAYNINSLKHYQVQNHTQREITTPRASKKRKQPQLIKTKGRNTEIFNKVRLVAYQEIKRSVNDNDFNTIILHYAHKLNKESYDYPLEDNELEGIVKSIVKYCLENKSMIKKYKNRGVLNLDNLLTLKEKQKLGANYSSKVKATKNEMKIKVAVIEMKKQELKINVSSVSKYTKLSRPTITKYKHFFKA